LGIGIDRLFVSTIFFEADPNEAVPDKGIPNEELANEWAQNKEFPN